MYRYVYKTSILVDVYGTLLLRLNSGCSHTFSVSTMNLFQPSGMKERKKTPKLILRCESFPPSEICSACLRSRQKNRQKMDY